MALDYECAFKFTSELEMESYGLLCRMAGRALMRYFFDSGFTITTGLRPGWLGISPDPRRKTRYL
jgi:hypothetical protein